MSVASVDQSEPLGGAWPEKANIEKQAIGACLKAASYFNEPICKARESFYRICTLYDSAATRVEKAAKAAFLVLGLALSLLIAPITTLPGALLRGLVAAIASKPFLYLPGEGSGKELPADRTFSLASYNVCLMPAGYSITDGGVTPPGDRVRIDACLKQIRKLDPDVICLYEVEDICDANYISSRLPEHPYVIPVAGFRAIGPSSMMYVASKYQIPENSIQFIPFEKGTELTGRAQFSEKGLLQFDLASRGEKAPFVTLFSTHLQHSEKPEEPELSEIASRQAQMRKITALMEQKVAAGGSVVLTGDLNQEEVELDAFLKTRENLKVVRDQKIRGIPTWGGDTWCATLMGKQVSWPLVLDYTLAAGKIRSIATQIFPSNYRADRFNPEAISDHFLLFSKIGLIK